MKSLLEKEKTLSVQPSGEFDVFYDCPILIGNLEELSSFQIDGVKHRFIGYKLGEFDKELFVDKLEKTIKAGTEVIGDIPYKQYTFIGIGPGMGGIEHLNNTTVSFNGNNLKTENDSGRFYQSLSQSSYNTWSDGAFGNRGNGVDKTISCYDKGAVVGFLLDLKIRHATRNQKSLDDVMKLLYWKYYKQLGRGFTEVEMQESCEFVAGVPLSDFFEYIFTTKDLDYEKYLDFAGLRISMEEVVSSKSGVKSKKLTINRQEQLDSLQLAVLKSWLSE